MIKESITPQDAVDTLNRALALDPGAVRKLMTTYTQCNEALANDESIQCGPRAGGLFEVGPLGLINGLFGADDSATGLIAYRAEVECPSCRSLTAPDEALAFGDPCPECGWKLGVGKILGFELLGAGDTESEGA